MAAGFVRIRFATLNVWSLRFRRRQHELHPIVVDQAPDVLAIQQTKLSTQKQVDQALISFLSTYDVGLNHAVGTSAGCLIFIMNLLKVSYLTLLTDEKGEIYNL